jgi:hypothetical protein
MTAADMGWNEIADTLEAVALFCFGGILPLVLGCIRARMMVGLEQHARRPPRARGETQAMPPTTRPKGLAMGRRG